MFHIKAEADELDEEHKVDNSNASLVNTSGIQKVINIMNQYSTLNKLTAVTAYVFLDLSTTVNKAPHQG